MRVTEDDTVGLVVATLITTLPLLMIAWFGDSVSKDPIGPKVYITPAIIGFTAALLSSFTVCWMNASVSRRIAMHAGCASLASFALLVTFCLWWGDWAFRSAGWW